MFLCLRYFLQIIGRCVTMVNQMALQNKSADQSCDFLCQELSHFLMYITHMFQSGTYLLLDTLILLYFVGIQVCSFPEKNIFLFAFKFVVYRKYTHEHFFTLLPVI